MREDCFFFQLIENMTTHENKKQNERQQKTKLMYITYTDSISKYYISFFVIFCSLLILQTS